MINNYVVLCQWFSSELFSPLRVSNDNTTQMLPMVDPACHHAKPIRLTYAHPFLTYDRPNLSSGEVKTRRPHTTGFPMHRHPPRRNQTILHIVMVSTYLLLLIIPLVMARTKLPILKPLPTLLRTHGRRYSRRISCCYIDPCDKSTVCAQRGTQFSDSCNHWYTVSRHDCRLKQSNCCFFDTCDGASICVPRGGILNDCTGGYDVSDKCNLSSLSDCCFTDACNRATICTGPGTSLNDSCPRSYKVSRSCKLTKETCCYKHECTGETVCSDAVLGAGWSNSVTPGTEDLYCRGFEHYIKNAASYGCNPNISDKAAIVTLGAKLSFAAYLKPMSPGDFYNFSSYFQNESIDTDGFPGLPSQDSQFVSRIDRRSCASIMIHFKSHSEHRKETIRNAYTSLSLMSHWAFVFQRENILLTEVVDEVGRHYYVVFEFDEKYSEQLPVW